MNHESTTPEVMPPSAELSADAIAEQVFALSLECVDALEDLGVRHTSLDALPDHPLSKRGYTVQEKYEGDQIPGSFKVRGAAASLYLATRAAETFGAETGVYAPVEYAVTATRGGHGLGVAYVAKQAGLKSSFIETTTDIGGYKLEKLKSSGATVRPHHVVLEDAKAAAKQAGELANHHYIDPYDALETMAGAASVAHETLMDLLEQQERGEIDLHKDAITITLPAGGGGLASACAIVFREAKRRGIIGDNFRTVVTQMQGCDQIVRQLKGQELLTAETIDPSIEGTNVLQPGELTMRVISDKEYVVDAISVPKFYVAKAMRYLTKLHGVPVEPAGALSMAGALFIAEYQGPAPKDGRRHVLLTTTTGINISEEAFSDFHLATLSIQERYPTLSRSVRPEGAAQSRRPTRRVARTIGNTSITQGDSQTTERESYSWSRVGHSPIGRR